MRASRCLHAPAAAYVPPWLPDALGIIEGEGITCAEAVGWPDNLDTHEGVYDVLDDGVLVHSPSQLLPGWRSCPLPKLADFPNAL
jgi:hypothetical protein